jgi:hypothetical protein
MMVLFYRKVLSHAMASIVAGLAANWVKPYEYRKEETGRRDVMTAKINRPAWQITGSAAGHLVAT